jgi:two-component system aerobic respiration control sensor histidine kinase ArcB
MLCSCKYVYIQSKAKLVRCITPENFNYVESGCIPVLQKRFNIKEVICDVLDLERPVAELKKLDLVAKLSEDIPEQLIGDEHRLKRILINLISNAIKFTEKGNIKVVMNMMKSKDDKMCLLSISIKDTGVGIPQDKQNLIYEKFARGVPANKGVHIGAGLGLRIVKQFIEEIDGEIDVQSKVGYGTTFTCTIPFRLPLVSRFAAVKAENIEDSPLETIAEADKLELNVLLVEDDKLAQMVAANVLKDEFKAEVDIASTGDRALELAANNNYDLIFMDIGLPDITGYDVTEKIRKSDYKNASTPIIALTAHSVKDKVDDAIAAGMNDFSVKPLNVEKIQKILDKWIYKKPETVAEVNPLNH